jgi:hypothetical protein
MAVVKSVTIHDDVAHGDLRERRYLVTITTNTLGDEEYILSPVIVDASDDGSIYGDQKLASLADVEAGGVADIAPEYQDQNDYDRRSLGRSMLEESTDDFYLWLSLFKGMEVRGGANANQRASYLGVLIGDYNLMANRFGDIEGIEFFLVDAKEQVWEDLPVEWL